MSKISLCGNFVSISSLTEELVIWYQTCGQTADLLRLPWYPESNVIGMSYDPSGYWLLCLADLPCLYILPVQAFLKPEGELHASWSTTDATQILLRMKGGSSQDCPICVNWWQTLDGQDVALIGTQGGYLVLVDLHSGNQLIDIDLAQPVHVIELVTDNTQTFTYSMVTTKDGSQWKILLEQKVETWVVPTSASTVHGTAARVKDSDVVPSTQMTTTLINIINSPDENIADFAPLRFRQFASSVTLSAQYSRGRHLVTAHDIKTSLYQVYDSNTNYAPLFMYRIPPQSHNVLVTDRLLFLMSDQDDTPCLHIISSQLAEVSSEYLQSFNPTSLVQKFLLPVNEKVIAIYRRAYPSYSSDKSFPSNIDESQFQPTRRTVLDGCIIITSEAIYECRPKISPEHLFVSLASTAPPQAEHLGIMLGLDVGQLFRLVANQTLQAGRYTTACKLLQLAKCPPDEKIDILVWHGRISEALAFASSTLNHRTTDVSLTVKTYLSDVLVCCFLQQYLKLGESHVSLHNVFIKWLTLERLLRLNLHSADLDHVMIRVGDSAQMVVADEFLRHNKWYSLNKALNLLAKYGQTNLILIAAKSRGEIQMGLELMLQNGQLCVQQQIKALLKHPPQTAGIPAPVIVPFLQTLSVEDLLQVLTYHPQLILDLLQELEASMSYLEDEQLVQLARLLDISQPAFGPLWQRANQNRNETYSKDVADGMELIDTFLHTVIQLNTKRLNLQDIAYLDERPSISSHQENSSVLCSSQRECLDVTPCLVSCGINHGGAISDGCLYMWGKPDHGRLGDGTTSGKTDKLQHSAMPVESLCLPGIRVRSVCCGTHHTLAITNVGLYGWGDSTFGQVGSGSNEVQSTPRLLQSPEGGMWVSLACGHYHSAALTSDFKLYTWGWGVHGQLGHLKVDNLPLPKLVAAVDNERIVNISAGYAHTLLCNDKGVLYSCGAGCFGQLGLGDAKKRTVPTRVATITEPVMAVATKLFISLALTSDGKLYTWGSHPNLLRQFASQARRSRVLGRRSAIRENKEYMLPTLVSTNMLDAKVAQVACCSMSYVLITVDGEVYTWGRNFVGQLGIGTLIEQKKPMMVVQINDVKVVSVGTAGSTVLVTDSTGVLRGWGRNEDGQMPLKPRLKYDTLNLSGEDQSYFAMPSPVILPLPTPPSSPSRHAKISVPDRMWCMKEEEDIFLPMRMPSLSGDEDHPYPPSTLHIIMQNIPHLVNITSTLRRSVDLGSWQCACVLAGHTRVIIKAFEYQLLALCISRSSLKNFTEQVDKCVGYYLRDIICEKSIEKRHKMLEMALQMLLEMWSNEDMCVKELENYLSDTDVKQSLAYPFFLLQSKVSANRGDKYMKTCRDTAETMSCQFKLDMLTCLLSQMENDGYIRHKMWCLLADTGLQEPQTGLEETTDRLVSADILWHHILTNIQNTNSNKMCITVSQNVLSEAGDSTDNTDGILPQTVSSKAWTVLFTCGHNFSRVAFLETVLPELEGELATKAGMVSDPASILHQYYTRDASIPLACPNCLIHTLKQL